MSNTNKRVLTIVIVVVSLALIFQALLFIFAISFPIVSFMTSKPEVYTDINEYNNLIGEKAKKEYRSKWGMNEKILPSKIEDSYYVQDFKFVYYNPWDAQYLTYLEINYNNEDYAKELDRLGSFGIESYEGIYDVKGFTNYRLLAMDSDPYYGFIYAMTDDNNKIIYVELIFCNNFMDLDYEEYIKKDYLPDGFNAKLDNPYSKRYREQYE